MTWEQSEAAAEAAAEIAVKEVFDMVRWDDFRLAVTGSTIHFGLVDRLRGISRAKLEYSRRKENRQLFTISYPENREKEVRRIVSLWMR